MRSLPQQLHNVSATGTPKHSSTGSSSANAAAAAATVVAGDCTDSPKRLSKQQQKLQQRQQRGERLTITETLLYNMATMCASIGTAGRNVHRMIVRGGAGLRPVQPGDAHRLQAVGSPTATTATTTSSEGDCRGGGIEAVRAPAAAATGVYRPCGAERRRPQTADGMTPARREMRPPAQQQLQPQQHQQPPVQQSPFRYAMHQHRRQNSYDEQQLQQQQQQRYYERPDRWAGAQWRRGSEQQPIGPTPAGGFNYRYNSTGVCTCNAAYISTSVISVLLCQYAARRSPPQAAGDNVAVPPPVDAYECDGGSVSQRLRCAIDQHFAYR